MSSYEYEVVRNAILKKQQIFAIYQGHRREMCPHVIGTKNGREQALFYQFGGMSSKGQIVPGSNNNWRCIPIEGLTSISTEEGEWYTGANHSRPQTCVDDVDIEVGN